LQQFHQLDGPVRMLLRLPLDAGGVNFRRLEIERVATFDAKLDRIKGGERRRCV
jgi:hypothetical protein